MSEVPINLDWLVSVDDHVIEPPNVWIDRIPSKYGDEIPHMVETKVGPAWLYDGKKVPTSGLSVTAGKSKEEFSPDPVTFDQMRPGVYDPVARVADMNQGGILASLCFPSFPRFCGQIFWEAKDKELALLCVKAYNDWMIEEWCGTIPGRMIPLTLIPLWDPQLAVKEIERCAAKGSTAIAFSENPEPLGLPTIHDPDGYWTPVMEACEATETVVCMHVGSSSTMPQISSDAPLLANLTFGAVRAAGTMLAWIFSDYFERMPNLKIALSEGNIGWMPYNVTGHHTPPRSGTTTRAASTTLRICLLSMSARSSVITSSGASLTRPRVSIIWQFWAKTTLWWKPITRIRIPRGLIALTWLASLSRDSLSGLSTRSCGVRRKSSSASRRSSRIAAGVSQGTRGPLVSRGRVTKPNRGDPLAVGLTTVRRRFRAGVSDLRLSHTASLTRHSRGTQSQRPGETYLCRRRLRCGRRQLPVLPGN
jgi:hypothetical protein